MEGERARHSKEIDALRGVAVLKVVLAHVAGYWFFAVKAPLPLFGVDMTDLFRLSVGGVFLFFFLSGYLLTGVETRRREHGPYRMRSYFARRALRILPAYYVAILAAWWFWPKDTSGWDLLTHALFLHTLFPETTDSLDPVMWSLASEVAWYILLPFVVLLLPRWWQRVLLLAGLLALGRVVSSYASAAVPGASPEEAVYVNHLPTTHLYLFAAGMLAYMLAQRAKPPAVVNACLAGASVVLLLGYPYFGPEIALALGIPGWLLVDLSMGAFFFAAVTGSPLLRPLLSWRPLRFCGEISYSMFLLHQTVLIVASPYILGDLRRLAETSAWLAFLALAVGLVSLSGVVAYASYRFVEKPFLAMKPK